MVDRAGWMAETQHAARGGATELAPGCRVRLRGLTSDAGQILNGKIGTVLDSSVSDKPGRWAVCLEGGVNKSFKTENLEVCV